MAKSKKPRLESAPEPEQEQGQTETSDPLQEELDATATAAAESEGMPSSADLDAQAEEEEIKEATAEPAFDRARCGKLLREGQRFAQHALHRVSMPEYAQWVKDVSEFIVHNGL